MRREIELLAPGGDVDSIKAAIAAGANAIYCGLDKFNARNRAANISFDELKGILRLAHEYNCEVFLTLNIIVVESEFPDLLRWLNRIVNTSIDGVIVQDLGLFYLLSNYFKGFKIHASTQLTTHNDGQIKFLSQLNASRVNLSRELNIREIKALTTTAHQHQILTEVFVHGSYCLCFSGICYMSSLHGGNSGNRGRCSQPCRDQYMTTAMGIDYPLNLKDNSAFSNIGELADAGVDSLKIEGRIKKSHYVYTIVESYKEQLERVYRNEVLSADVSKHYTVFNRDFSNSFLTGTLSRDAFINNPRDHSAIHLAQQKEGGVNEQNSEEAKSEIFEKRTALIDRIENKIETFSIAQIPLKITVSGKCGESLLLEIQTSDASFEITSEVSLKKTGTKNLSHDDFFKRFKVINETDYCIEHIGLDDLEPNLYLPFKELTSLKNQLLFLLNDSKEAHVPVEVPALSRAKPQTIKPSLSVLIASTSDLYLCDETNADIYYQLPDGLANVYDELIVVFQQNSQLIPWFSSILIGDDYRVAVDLLQCIKPRLLVTNNTGIAYEANKMGLAWIAGPYLNLVNSYALLCLKENFNCSGAFISNELNKRQIRGIKKPENFNLYYRIYYPVLLMTTRQCLFHQVEGCHKDRMDEHCMSDCKRSTTITNVKNKSFRIEKSKDNYHKIYNESNFLNVEIMNQIPDLFTGFFIDLTDVKTGTHLTMDKKEIIQLFESHLDGDLDSSEKLKENIYPTTNVQFVKGI